MIEKGIEAGDRKGAASFNFRNITEKLKIGQLWLLRRKE
jgi:hypothetical protein